MKKIDLSKFKTRKFNTDFVNNIYPTAYYMPSDVNELIEYAIELESENQQLRNRVGERIENIISKIKNRHGSNEVKTFIFLSELDKIREELGARE